VGTNKECCADFVVSSYTPTVTALLRAQRATRTVSRNDLSLALIAEDRPQEAGLPVAPEMQKEIECAATIAKLNDVAVVHQQAGSTTIARTTDVMQEANVVHLACHSVHDDHNAIESGFYFGDGRLTISKLKLESPFLLFHVSADSSKHDKDQPDQMTPLATYMLYSGFQNVVTTMWYVKMFPQTIIY
jgi:CHAT domain-containing protein